MKAERLISLLPMANQHSQLWPHWSGWQGIIRVKA